MTPAEVLMVAALALVFAPLERLVPIRRAPPAWTRLRVDALHLFVSGTLIRGGSVATAAALALAAGRLMPEPWREAVRSQPDWLEFIELLLLSDLAFYGAHRLFHAVPFLWRFQAVHHSSEHLDWLAAYRVHPGDQIVNAAIIMAPAVFLGFSPGPALAYAFAYRWHAVLLHSNVRVDFGPLKWIVASPQYHHWHHADVPEAYDRNFGGQLVLFDRLFGTLNLPRGPDMPPKYGLDAPFPTTYLGQLAHPLRPPARTLSALGERP